MTTFTISQEDYDTIEEVYAYPNSDIATCTEFTARGTNPNYTNVCEPIGTYNSTAPHTYTGLGTDSSRNDMCDSSNYKMDLFGLESVSTANMAAIRAVTVYLKLYDSNIFINHSTGAYGSYYAVVSPDSVCTNYYSSWDFQNVGWIKCGSGYECSWGFYSWNKNPESGSTWSWNDLANLAIGYRCKSTRTTSWSDSEILTPNHDGGTIEWTKKAGTSTNYENVVTSGDGNYNYLERDAASWAYDYTDIFTCTNTTKTWLTVNSVVVYGRFRCSDSIPDDANDNLDLGLSSGGALDWKNVGRVNEGAYSQYNKSWNVDPAGGAWTQTDLDNLIIGYNIDIYGSSLGDKDYWYTDNLYAEVNGTAMYESTVSVYRCYAKISYYPKYECSLNKPTEILTTHDRIVKMFNFWNGDREVYDYARSGKTMVLKGSEFYQASTCTNPCSRIICMRDMGRVGSPITISGLNPAYFNGEYRIISFGWNKISEKPEHYEWVLELEDNEE